MHSFAWVGDAIDRPTSRALFHPGIVNVRKPHVDSPWAGLGGRLQIGSAAIGNWGLPSERHRRSQIRNLNGRMDELIVFGQALDDAEVRRAYKAGRP